MDQQPRRDIVPLRARPLTEGPVRTADGHLPPIVAKTVNICVNCVQGAGRSVTGPIRRRYERHYHSRHRHGRVHFVADVALITAVVLLVGVNGYLLSTTSRTPPSRIQLTWTVPETVRNGAAVSLDLAYRYTGAVALDRAAVTFQPSPEFTIASVTPGTYDVRTHTLVMSEGMTPGAAGMIRVIGSVLAPDGSAVVLPVTFSGTGDSVHERQRAEAVFPIRGVAIAFAVESPSLIPAFGGAIVGVRYRSEATVPLRDISVRAEFSFPSVRSGTETPPDRTIAVLAPGGEGVLRIPIDTGKPGVSPLTFTVSTKSERGESMLLGATTVPIDVRDAGIGVWVETMGLNHPFAPDEPGSDGPGAVRVGDRFQVIARYSATTGGGVPSGASLPADAAREVRLAYDLLPRSTVTPNDRGTLFPGNMVRWPFVGVPEGGIGKLSATVRIPSTLEPAVFPSDGDLTISFSPTVVLAVDGDQVPTAWVSSTEEFPGHPYTSELAGELRLVTIARYYTPEGDQIGRGPLPPRVGATTRYWVTWDAQSRFRGARDVVVRAVLGDSVEWTGRVSTIEGPSPQFDPGSRTVTWRVGSLDPTIGAERPAATASFELAFSPHAPDVGRAGTLLTASTIEGVDAIGIPGVATAPSATTDLTLDQRARGRGAVQGE